MTGNGWKWLDMAGMAGNCCKCQLWLEIASNGLKQLKIAGNCWQAVKGTREFHKRSRNSKNRNRVPSPVTV